MANSYEIVEKEAPPTRWIASPFLHVDADRIYNPLTERELTPADPQYAAVRALVDGSVTVDARVISDGWAVAAGSDLSTASRLKIVSLETMTACNQKCYFCPVSIEPRQDATMPEELFARIISELTAYRDTLEGVFLQSYNEPTLDRDFVSHCRALFAAKLPAAVLTNGSGLTPSKVDALIESGPLAYLCVNLSTLDRDRYRSDRGHDHLPIVLSNLDYMKDRPVAHQMRIVVLGRGDETHDRDFAAIEQRFAGSRFSVERHVVMDRAGWLEIGLRPAEPHTRLAGCDNLGSRPLQHLHITPRGKCVLCCEDYDENYVVGDLITSTIAEVLAGQTLAQMRRWAYGIEEAPADFICRNCVFARTRKA